MFARKNLLKIAVGISLILCLVISAIVFYKAKKPDTQYKSEQQLRAEAIQKRLELIGRPTADGKIKGPPSNISTASDINAIQVSRKINHPTAEPANAPPII